MAKNRYRSRGRKLHLRVADINGSGAGNLCKSGDPGVLGGVLPCVCLTDEDADGRATVDTLGVYKLDVANATGAELVPNDTVVDVNWDNAAGVLTTAAGDFFGRIVGGDNLAIGATGTVEVRVGY